MSNRTVKDASKDIVFVPLSRLKKSPKNVRKVPHTKADIKAFAASIAALGMLQYPVVEPEQGPRGNLPCAMNSLPVFREEPQHFVGRFQKTVRMPFLLKPCTVDGGMQADAGDNVLQLPP